MRLLNVHNFSFKVFHPPHMPKYAIASHRWLPDGEAMLDDIRAGNEQSSQGYIKVKGFAEFVKTRLPSIEWLWIDTCCIDQRHGPELSEAINSMFRWYADATVCLAWLSDVSSASNMSAFKHSEWFQRGWTLQELLAPKFVVFLSQDWQVIGHKGESPDMTDEIQLISGPRLVEAIADITHISVAVVHDYSQANKLSVEEKLRWMEGRVTTKPEDHWYCVLGILGVSMNIRYGDGRDKTWERIFNKLQKANGRRVFPKPTSNVPFRPDPHFVDRKQLAQQIESQLAEPGSRVALVGIGGVGKSQLAIEHARHVRQQFPATWVLWIHASSTARFEQSVRDILTLLDVPGRAEPSADLLQLLHDRLRQQDHGDWLIVLDNADGIAFLLEKPSNGQAQRRRLDYIPVCDHGKMLITSRVKSEALKLVHQTDIVEVRPMSEVDAVRLLRAKLERSDEDIIRLARALDCIPLALTQAAAYIRERSPHYTWQQYYEALHRSRSSRQSLLRRHPILPNRDEEASNSVILTWQISFEHVSVHRPSAANLLAFMSFCDRLAIPEILLCASDDIGEEEKEQEKLASSFDEDIVTLCNFSFISPTTEPRSWEMHRLIQDAMQFRLQEQGVFNTVFEHFVDHFWRVMPDGTFGSWALCHSLMPHARKLSGQKPQARWPQLQWAEIMYASAWYAYERGEYGSALLVAKVATEPIVEHLGVHSEQAMACDSLVGTILAFQGHLSEAEAWLTMVVEMERRVLGEDESDLRPAVAQLGVTYSKQERWREAEMLLTRVQETCTRVLGADHPHTLKSMGTLAITYVQQGRWAEAEKLQLQHVEVCERVFGSEHPDTLGATANLAVTYSYQGRVVEQVQLLLELVGTCQRVLGSGHPDTLINVFNLVDALMERELWVQAEKVVSGATEICRRELGSEHPQTLSSMFRLAVVFCEQGKLQRAQTLFMLCGEARTRILGDAHPQTQACEQWLARVNAALARTPGSSRTLGPGRSRDAVAIRGLES